MEKIGFKLSISHPDVWIIVYVNDILCISVDPKRTMQEITRSLRFNNDKIYPPELYLVTNLEKKMLNNTEVWTITSRDYVKAAIENVEQKLSKKK